AQRAPRPYLALNPDDASVMRSTDGTEMELVLNGAIYRLPVRIHSALPRGVAGLPGGLRDLPWAPLPEAGRIWRITKVEGNRSITPDNRRRAVRRDERRRRPDLARAASAGFVAGSLRTQSRGTFRIAPTAGRYDQDLRQRGLDSPIRRPP